MFVAMHLDVGCAGPCSMNSSFMTHAVSPGSARERERDREGGREGGREGERERERERLGGGGGPDVFSFIFVDKLFNIIYRRHPVTGGGGQAVGARRLAL
jgi:hypothetical protein